VVRYSFTVSDLHHLLLFELLAHEVEPPFLGVLPLRSQEVCLCHLARGILDLVVSKEIAAIATAGFKELSSE
jgi:hypothetical protein